MSLQITYYAQHRNPNMYGRPITSVALTASGTSAATAVVPTNAEIARIHSTANNRYAINANPTATATAGDSGHYLASGATIDIPVMATDKIAVITAS